MRIGLGMRAARTAEDLRGTSGDLQAIACRNQPEKEGVMSLMRPNRPDMIRTRPDQSGSYRLSRRAGNRMHIALIQRTEASQVGAASVQEGQMVSICAR